MPAMIDFLGVIEQNVIKPSSFIRDNFFKDIQTHDKQRFEIEYKKGGQLVAPFVSEFIPGTEMIKRGYHSSLYTAPKVAPKRTFTGHEIFLEKQAGETIYGGLSGEEKKAKLFAESFNEFEEQITRREELMCIKALFEGKIKVVGEGVEDEINFGEIKEVVPAVAWNLDNADIMGDIESIITDIGATTGETIEMIVMDPVAAKDFLNNPKIQKLMDTRNFNVGNIDVKALGPGVIFYGYLAPYNIPIYSYQTQIQVLNDDGKTFKTEKLIPEGRVLFAPSNNKMHYGCAVDITQGVIAAKRVPFEDVDNKSNTAEIRTESRPLPVPRNLDAIRVLKTK